MKGTILTGFSNVKPMDGVPQTTGLAMNIGDYAFGTASPTGSDLINFDHFYRANGVRVELSELCKASAANMRLDNVSEPDDTPPPPTEDYILHVVNGLVTRYNPE